MHKKLYSLIFAAMLGSMHTNAESIPQETYEFDADAAYYAEQERAYQEYVAFEKYLETEASLEVKALVKCIERDFMLGFQILINCMEGMLRRNASLVIDECKDSSESLNTLGDDLVTIVDEIGYICQEFIFNRDKYDEMLDMEPEDGLILFKNKIEELFAFIDILPTIYGQRETYRVALVNLDTTQEQEMCSEFKEKCCQVDSFSEKVFLNSIPAIQVNVPEMRAVIHSLFDATYCLIEMTDCTQYNFMRFVQARIQNIVDIYNQLAQEFIEEHGSRFVGKHLKDLSQEDMMLAIELDLVFCELCQKAVKQILTGLQEPS